RVLRCRFLVFFFQAEDGIRDGHVTGVQTCALPIFPILDACFAGSATFISAGDSFSPACSAKHASRIGNGMSSFSPSWFAASSGQIGRASCRERGESAGAGVVVEKEMRRSRGWAVVV